MSQTEDLLKLDPAVAREYLLAAAASLKTITAPGYAGDIGTRSNECVLMLLRIAQQLGAPAASVKQALATADSGSALADEATVIDAAESDLSALLASLDTDQARKEDFDNARCEAYLRQHDLGAASLKVASSKQLQGGRSKQTVLATLQDQGEAMPAEIVIRQDWNSSVTGTSVVSEFEVLRSLADTGLKVPRPLLLEPAPEALGGPFIIVHRLPGRGEGNIFFPPKSEVLAEDVAEQLGRLHALAAAQFENLAGIKTVAFTHEQLRADLEGYRKLYQQLDKPSQTIGGIIDWLSAHIDQVEGPRTLVHGDIGFHNLLVNQGRLTGVLDWELAHLGHPAEDLGYCKGDVEQMTSWSHFMQAYRSAGGPEISDFMVDFFTLWGGLRLYALLLQARAAIRAALLRDPEVAYVSIHMMPVLFARLSSQFIAIQPRH